MKIIGISGSLREGSHNSRLLHSVAHLLEDDIEFEQVSIDLPMFTDNEDSFPDQVLELRDKVRNCDAIFITCPEYNWNITTALKNAIDWLSRGADTPLRNHVVGIAGVGGGRLGSARAQLVLRQTLLHSRTWTVPGPEVLIVPNDNLFGEDDLLTDAFALKLLKDLIDELVRVAEFLRNKI